MWSLKSFDKYLRLFIWTNLWRIAGPDLYE